MATFSNLRALHALIGDALDDVERIFVSCQPSVHSPTGSESSDGTQSLLSPSASEDEELNRIPLDFPSLDGPYDPHSPAEALLSHPAVVHATKLIVSATGQLAAMVQRPFLTICDATMGYHLPSCMRFLEASHVVEIMRETGPAGLHIRELAARADCDPNKLGHILRLLATHHIGTEVSPNVFANNRLSSFIDSGKDFNVIKSNPADKYEGTNGIAAYVGMCTDELFKSSAYLTDAYLLNDISKHSTLTSAAPFNLAFGTKGQFFNWLDEEGNEMRLKRFGHAMTGTAGYEDGGSISQAGGFDWGALGKGSLIVDVGGGIGSTSMTLAKAFPHLRFCIQDRPKTVELGILAWKERCPERLDSGEVVFQAHDFFTPQPIRNAAVFLLRVITHDWPDEFVTRILLQLRNAATPQTKLILVDYVLPFACEDRTGDIGAVRTMAPPSSGLLPNLGKANANAFWLDMTMHVTFNSKERTLREMTDIALSAGWQVVEVIRKPEGSPFGSIIAVPTSVPPSTALLSSLAEQEIIERAGSPVGDTFYSRTQLPSRGTTMEMNQSDSAVRRMTKRLRKTISRTFSRGGQGGEVGEEKRKPPMAKSASD